MIFDPTFSADGSSVIFGVVEETFFGEDDRLDNMWVVNRAGDATRITSLSEPTGRHDWTILRGPVTRSDGEVLMTTASHGDEMWRAVVTDGFNDLELLGPVPERTVPVSISSDHIAWLTENSETLKFDLIQMEIGDQTTWDYWCELPCTTLAANIDAASVAPSD